MLIDDTNEKLRRNLIVLSFTIVIGSFMGLDFDQQGKLFSVISYTELSPLKFWSTLLAIQTYVFLRYWFDGDREKDKTRAKDEYEALKQNLISFILCRELKKAILKKRMPRWIIDFKELEEPNLQKNYKDNGLPSKVISNVNLEKDAVNSWNGWLSKNYSAEWKDKGFYSNSGGYRYQYILGPIIKWVIRLLATTKHLTFSKTNVDFYIPVVLAALAIGVCVFQIIGSQ